MQLQVWIAVFSTISNVLLAYGFAEGVAIRFWLIAQRGTTVGILDFFSPNLPTCPYFVSPLLLVVFHIQELTNDASTS